MGRGDAQHGLPAKPPGLMASPGSRDVPAQSGQGGRPDADRQAACTRGPGAANTFRSVIAFGDELERLRAAISSTTARKSSEGATTAACFQRISKWVSISSRFCESSDRLCWRKRTRYPSGRSRSPRSRVGRPGAVVTTSLAWCSRGIRTSIHSIAHSVSIPSPVPIAPRPSWPPPKQRPITVAIHRVAAVVTPVIEPPFFKIAPPPRKPTPVRIPSGNRIRSMTANEPESFPPSDSRILAWIIATEAAKVTRIVVRRPAAWPRTPRLNPINAPATIVMTRRTKISSQVGWSGIIIGLSGARLRLQVIRGQLPAAMSGSYDNRVTYF